MALALLLLQDQKQFEATHSFTNDADVTEYAEQLCRKLSPEVSVRVVRANEVRAAAWPGRIYVTTGLISRAENEAQFAGALAHEIAHATNAGSAVDAESGACIRFAQIDPRLPDGKERERTADEAALAMVIKSGYDPAPMLDFFSKVRREQPHAPTAFSSEDILLEKLQLEATDHPIRNGTVNTPEFVRIRAKLKPVQPPGGASPQ
ncbi:MAG TPA: M48 family metalloprotease [Bryobacteraceae bacterium]|nr:M48 family metalloprotease [Bryobacteraceae bacterium]